MKDSGIPWIGGIFEHWQVKKLRYIASFKSDDNIMAGMINKMEGIKLFELPRPDCLICFVETSLHFRQMLK